MRLSGFLQLWDREILQDAGKVTAELAMAYAESEFEKYRIVQDRLFVSDFDRMITEDPLEPLAIQWLGVRIKHGRSQ